jgi:predicted ATPase
LEAQFSEMAETQPELLAHHATEAGLTEKAVHYWYQAGQRASERSAHVEAISHLRTGLALLQTLSETPEHRQQQVEMSLALGASLIATKGYAAPEVGETYTSAQQLCQYLEDPYQLSPVLRGLWSYYLMRAELQTAHTLGEQLLTLAQQAQDTVLLLAVHRALGTTLFFLGTAALAHTYLAQAMALYDPQQHRAHAFLSGEDAGVVCRSHAAWTLWYLGYPDQGLARNEEAVILAQHIVHPHSLGYALTAAATFHQLRREGRAAQECADASIRLAIEQGFPQWMAISAMLRGWALAHQGQAKEGIAQITEGLTAYRGTGAETLRPYFLALLAEAHGVMGQPEEGLTVLAEALTHVDKTGERWYESEIHRLKGALLLQQALDNATAAESCFQQAISIARAQQATSLELRAATSLARLWQQQGKRDEARQVLGDIYGWFTEGFDTIDLKDAKALLYELEDGR